MFQLPRTPGLAHAALALSLVACGGASTDSTAPVTVPSIVTSSLTSGSWAVSSLTQRTENKASKFSGYTFVFSGDGESGTVTASQNGTTLTGTWNHAAAVTYYGSTSKESMTLNLGVSAPFDMLSKTWNVESNSSSKLTLVNPEIAEDSHLIFSKQ